MPLRRGSITVIAGPMFSGKSEVTLRELRRAEVAQRRVLLVRPAIDDRVLEAVVRSRSGSVFPAVLVTCASEIVARASEAAADVVAIEEAQFFDSEIVEAVETLAARGCQVIVNGLNQDFAGRPFGSMPQLLARADAVTILSAICTVCGEDASKTQRFVDGRPARASDPLVLVGGFADETYTARCRAHYQVPD